MPRALQRVSVRPTARGWQMVFFGTLVFLAAWLLGTTQLYQLAYAFAGLFLVALVLGFVIFRGVRYMRRIPEGKRLAAGRPSHVELVITNASRTRSPLIEVVDALPERRSFEAPPVEGLGKQVIGDSVLLAKRGLYQLGPAEVRAIDPFGLLRFVRRFATRTEVVVYPEVFELESFPAQGRSMESGGRSSFVQQGDEFSGLREYRWGDDRRHIHWKSVARTGELVVKEFAHNAPRRHVVLLDLKAGVHVPEAEVEDAISAAGSVLRHLALEGSPFRLLCTDKEGAATIFGVKEAAYWRALDLLATVQADGDMKFSNFLDEKLREEREGFGEGVVLISRSLGGDLIRSVERLRAVGLSVFVVALAVHNYRGAGENGGMSEREAAFYEDTRRLERAGAAVRVVHHPGGVAAFAKERRGAADIWGVV
ncbi:MAG: DUF58 domain-containing protein [Rubrobacter sp.]|nr:DUF58 domain-containing protein [Rubrobacter sp.]